MTSPQTTRGAHSLHGDDEGGKRKRPAWLWLLLPLLALLALGAFLLAQNSGDDGDDEGIDATDEPSDDAGSTTTSPPSSTTAGDAGTATTATTGDTGSGTTDSTAATGPSTTTGSGTAQSTEGDGASSTVTTAGAGGGVGGTGQAGQIVTTDDAQPVLPVPASGLAGFSGTEVEATSVTVESVVADEGFWVGSSTTDRVFVRLQTSGESPQQVRAGQMVSFTGTVAPVPADVEGELGVEADEGADQLIEQGQLIEVSTVEQG